MAQAFEAVPYSDPRSPALAVASALMENTSLHTDIRERGGAYGASASLHSLTGIWSFGSYRDPHIHKTGEAFQRAVEKIVRGDFSDQELLEAQLSTLQTVDSLPAPGARGAVAWRRLREGLFPEVRQNWKNGVIDASRQRVIRAVEEVLLPQIGRWDPVVFAGKEVLLKEGVQGAEPVIQTEHSSEGDDFEDDECC